MHWFRKNYGLQERHDKVRKYFFVWFNILIYIHTMCCFWIFIGSLPGGWYITQFMRENADHPDSEKELVSLAMEEMTAKVYVDAWNDIVLTVMKVGYGMHQVTFLEQVFLFLLMFVSAFVFAIAAQYTAPLQLRSPLKQFLIDSQQDL